MNWGEYYLCKTFNFFTIFSDVNKEYSWFEKWINGVVIHISIVLLVSEYFATNCTFNISDVFEIK